MSVVAIVKICLTCTCLRLSQSPEPFLVQSESPFLTASQFIQPKHTDGSGSTEHMNASVAPSFAADSATTAATAAAAISVYALAQFRQTYKDKPVQGLKMQERKRRGNAKNCLAKNARNPQNSFLQAARCGRVAEDAQRVCVCLCASTLCTICQEHH